MIVFERVWRRRTRLDSLAQLPGRVPRELVDVVLKDDGLRDVACEADRHLPDLVDALVQPAKSHAEALDLRPDASQVLRHPFLDTTEERRLARAAASKQASSSAVLSAQRGWSVTVWVS